MTIAAEVTRIRTSHLRRDNAAMALLHSVQGVAILLLANNFSLPVTATFMTGPPGAGPPELVHLFDVRIAWGVALFLFISAAAHALLITPGVFGWYRENLQRNRSYGRWAEYSLSASVMIVLIAMLTGISDIAALGAIFGVNTSMILFGLLMEHYERPGGPNWLPFWFGTLAGAVPWVLIGIYLWSPTIAAEPPGFVYGIFVSLFLFFNSFAINMVLQYRRVGPWRDYEFGERVYILLSLTAKSALAWQVFASTLAV